MLPCFCTCGRTVYSRYKPLYLLMMLNLADSHQDAEAQLMNGNLFTIQKSSTNPFGRVPADQETEMGVNRDSKSPGGIADISMNPMQRHSHGNSCQLRLSEGGGYAVNFHSQRRSERQVPHLWRCWQTKSQKRWREGTSHHEHCFEVEQSICWWRSLLPYLIWQTGIGRSCKRYVTGSWERKVVTSTVCNRETAGTMYYSWRTSCSWWCIGRSCTSVK